MVVVGTRQQENGDKVVVGIGLSVVAAFQAKHTNASNIIIVLKLGTVFPEPLVAELNWLSNSRIWYRAKDHANLIDMLETILHKVQVDVWFLGGFEMSRTICLRPCWDIRKENIAVFLEVVGGTLSRRAPVKLLCSCVTKY